MSDGTTLLPCPFCGGEIPAPTRRYMSVLICPTCNAYGPGNSDMTNDELIAAWNTRAYLNPDGLPVGLTISDDGNLINWRGENYVKQGILGNGTLTAEQVREAVEASTWAETSTLFEFGDSSWQAIADELNSELGSGTCERTTTRNGKFKTKYGRKVPLCECCGYAIGDDRYNYCPKCGAKIVKAVKR